MFKAACAFSRGDVLIVRDDDNEVKEYHYTVRSAYDTDKAEDGTDMVCITFARGVQIFPAFEDLEFTTADDED